MSSIVEDMVGSELTKILVALNLTPADFAARLGVAGRTVRRWQTGEQAIPIWVVEVFDAWRQLHAAGVPWGADLESIWYGDDDQVRRHQDHDKALAAVLRQVKARGGPAAPWRINLRQHSATLGQMSVRFYRLASGSFSLQNYRRGDVPPDVRRDRALIEDAVFAFSEAVGAARAARPNRAWDE
jgi:transcriptional regulator with XRE-family HTH domain